MSQPPEAARRPVRPRPRGGIWEDPFWSFVSRRQLRLQRCRRCGKTWFPPGPVCPSCLSEDWQWTAISGAGTLLSWTTFHRQYFPTIPPPHTVAAVLLDEGPILIADVDAPPDRLVLDGRMRLTYHEVDDLDGNPFQLYRWTPHTPTGYSPSPRETTLEGARTDD
ncbi:Zn-ribbon domain-containing OB-fold protein [Nocardioides cheoyonin]|uniref:Zn-ribbon domain-containing OB-fold protein n=1 Tax=Nocardioides cheoyonin TaxID=3156615 RepID=UPI0032B3B517